MSNPRYYLLIMFVFVCLVALVCALLFIPLKQAFMSNWGFNLIIAGALLIGILLNIRRVMILEPEINWIKIFRTGTSGLSAPRPIQPVGLITAHRARRNQGTAR